MPELDAEEFYQTDSSDNEEGHSKLITSVSQLDSTQRVKPAQRKEIASEVSEFNLGESLPSRRNLINVKELVEVLGKKAKHEIISKKIESITKKSKTLPKPLEKVTEEKLKRSIGFENVKKQLGRWDAIVERNSLKDQISFPLNGNSVKMQKSNEFLSQFKSTTPLEEEIAKVLKEENTNEPEKEEDEFPLTLEEMREKRKELAQLRAKLSYRQAKATRQSKIKSKKYHRLLKREKIRQQLKEFEILQKTDPEAALKKLSELDKTRAKERASLRHRNTGQWAKNMSVRAKYDVETRKVLADQLKMSRELTQKVSQLESSDDEEEEAGDKDPPVNGVQGETKPVTTFGDNPWTLDVSKEVEEFVSGYKKFWSEQQKEINQKRAHEEEMKEKNGEGRKILNEEKTKQKNGEGRKILNEEKTKEKNGEGRKILNEDGDDRKVPAEKRNRQKREVPNEKCNREKRKVPDEKCNGEKREVPNEKRNGKKRKVPDEEAKGEASKESPVKKRSKVCKKVEKGKKPESKKLPKKENPKIKNPKKKNPKKESPKRKKKCISIHPTSGVWIVEEEAEPEVNNKTKQDNLENLFDELNDGLMAKAKKRAKNLEAKLRKEEKKMKKAKKKEEGGSRFNTALKNPNIMETPDEDRGLLEGGEEDVLEEDGPVVAVPESKAPVAIDPQNFIQLKPKRLMSQLPDNITGDEEAIDDDRDQQLMIEEAFGGDDVLEEFQERKAEEERQNQISIETSLPGWGCWGGTGIKPKRKKRRLLVLNVPPRKKQKENVIINENENPNLKNHLVKEVPHPFKSVEAFEATIRTPVGRDWVPETAHHKLIQKQVVTKLGTVIEPMSEEEIIKAKKAARSPYRGKKGKKT